MPFGLWYSQRERQRQKKDKDKDKEKEKDKDKGRAQELSKSIGLYASTGGWRVWNRSDRTVLQVRFFKTSSTIVFLLFLSAFMALWIFPSNPASIDIIIILIGTVNVFACEWFSKNEIWIWIWIFGICLATPRKRNILKINDKVFSF